MPEFHATAREARVSGGEKAGGYGDNPGRGLVTQLREAIFVVLRP